MCSSNSMLEMEHKLITRIIFSSKYDIPVNSQSHGFFHHSLRSYSVTISQFKLYMTAYQCMSKHFTNSFFGYHSEIVHCDRSFSISSQQRQMLCLSHTQ